MPVLADSGPMTKTDIKSKQFLNQIYIQQMQGSAVCFYFCQDVLHLR